jgi:hypothetical protein
MISYNVLRGRRRDIAPQAWILDSGAFTEVMSHGWHRTTPEEYAKAITRWSRCGDFRAAVAQDYMCEAAALERTGLTIPEHQRLTTENYRALKALVSDQYVLMPVLQGFEPADYRRHLTWYGDTLTPGQWVGVGTLCKRNRSVGEVETILRAIKSTRPDLRLHGFGLKVTALTSGLVRDLLHSADSMAWSFAARKAHRNANDPREAERFVRRVATMAVQETWSL